MIVGADSLIGRTLCASFAKKNIPVYATSRRQYRDDPQVLEFDLAKPPGIWQLPIGGLDWVIFCAGITNISTCESNPSFTRSINVDRTIAFLEKVCVGNCQLLWFSTNMVFDGEEPFPGTIDMPNPKTEYGKQKLEVERYLLKSRIPSTVLRLTKVVNSQFPLFQKWKESLSCLVPINPFYDMTMAPVFLDRLVDLILDLLENPVMGILHYSGLTELSYADAALLISDILRLDASLVQPIRKPAHIWAPRFATMQNSPFCETYCDNYRDGFERLFSEGPTKTIDVDSPA